MSQYGQYDPLNAENASGLFNYQEVPLTSSKMNLWNGNITASFQLLHKVCSLLFSPNRMAVICHEDEDGLRVVAADPEDMTVQVNAGWAILSESFAGLLEPQALPVGGLFSPPVQYARRDLIFLKPNGELDVLEGVESENPVAPDTPPDSIPLTYVHHRVGSEKIFDTDQGDDSYLIDVRPAWVWGDAHKHSPDSAPSEAPDGVRTQFTTQHVYRSGTLEVLVNGVIQEKDVDFTEDADRRGYAFLQPPPSHYRIQHRYVVERN